VPDRERDRGPSKDVDVSGVPDAVPRKEPKSRYGNPKSYVVFGKRYYTMNSSEGFSQRGIASWYGEKFHGRKTSSGEVYDMYKMTAAHKELPLPSYVRVINISNGREVVVRVNDRGPFHENRIIDLSYAAAKKLGIVAKGTGLVEIQILDGSRSAQPVQATAPIRGADAEGPVPFYLQVGAYAYLKNAEVMREKIRYLIKEPVNILDASSNGRSLFRVRIGPLLTINASDVTAKTLMDAGIGDYLVVFD
jgi:rare lipoprotein A